MFNLDYCPSSLEDFSCSLLMFVFVGFAWTLWITRNKMAIEKVFPKAPSDVIYVAISLMQKWSQLLRGKNKERVDQILENILSWMKNFRPNAILLSDVSDV
jgi:hypothetical protein